MILALWSVKTTATHSRMIASSSSRKKASSSGFSPQEKISGPLHPGSARSRSSRSIRKKRSTGPLSRPEDCDVRTPGGTVTTVPWMSDNSREALRRVSRKCRMRHLYDIGCEITTRGVRPYNLCRISRRVTYRVPLTWGFLAVSRRGRAWPVSDSWHFFTLPGRLRALAS